jgi:hypothetical protein
MTTANEDSLPERPSAQGRRIPPAVMRAAAAVVARDLERLLELVGPVMRAHPGMSVGGAIPHLPPLEAMEVIALLVMAGDGANWEQLAEPVLAGLPDWQQLALLERLDTALRQRLEERAAGATE